MFSNYRLGAICFVGQKLNELEYSFEEGLQFPFNHFWHPEDFCSSLEEERSNFSAHSISITTMIMIFTTVCSNMKQSSAFFCLSIGHRKHSLTSLIFLLFVFLQSSQNPLPKFEQPLHFSRTGFVVGAQTSLAARSLLKEVVSGQL